MKTTKQTILMAYSSIKEGFAKADYGTFETVEAATKAGKGIFKSLNWLVASEVTRRPEGKQPETTYDYLSEIFKPSRR